MTRIEPLKSVLNRRQFQKTVWIFQNIWSKCKSEESGCSVGTTCQQSYKGCWQVVPRTRSGVTPKSKRILFCRVFFTDDLGTYTNGDIIQKLSVSKINVLSIFRFVESWNLDLSVLLNHGTSICRSWIMEPGYFGLVESWNLDIADLLNHGTSVCQSCWMMEVYSFI